MTRYTDKQAHLMADMLDELFPCDAQCSTLNEGPQEDCSRHGRSPSDLWGKVSQLNETIARVGALIEHVATLHSELPEPRGALTRGYDMAMRDVARILSGACVEELALPERAERR